MPPECLGGGGQVGSRGQEGTLPDKPVTPFNTSTQPVISLSWHRQQLSLPPRYRRTHTRIHMCALLSSQHSSPLKLAYRGGQSTPNSPPWLLPNSHLIARPSASSRVLTRAVTLTGTPDPPPRPGDLWRGRKFKWFSSNSRPACFSQWADC